MPLIRYLPLKLLGQGFRRVFWHVIATGMRQCVVKQFQPSGNLTSQLELKKLFEREAEVLEEIGSQHDQIPTCMLSLS